jgi:hypothetical protein
MVQEYPLKLVVQDSRRNGICHLIFFKYILLKKQNILHFCSNCVFLILIEVL